MWPDNAQKAAHTRAHTQTHLINGLLFRRP